MSTQSSVSRAAGKRAAAQAALVTATPKALPRTWNYGPGISAGVFNSPGQNPHPVELIQQASHSFPGTKTFLYYKSVGSDTFELPVDFFDFARAEGITPQIAFESGSLSLPEMQKALAGKGSLPETSASGKPLDENARLNAAYQNLSEWADYLKDKGPIAFRALSEMNDASGAWELGKPGNTPQDYAAVWNGMHQLFDAHGATNLRWTFDPLATQGAERSPLVRQVLKQIAPSYIDNVAVNPYAVHQGGQFESFKSLVDPWLQIFKETGHANAQPIVGEMGVSNNTAGHNTAARSNPNALTPGTSAYHRLDEQRAQWIHDAFAYCRQHKFAAATYFTEMDTHWRLDEGSLARKALQNEIARG